MPGDSRADLRNSRQNDRTPRKREDDSAPTVRFVSYDMELLAECELIFAYDSELLAECYITDVIGTRGQVFYMM